VANSREGFTVRVQRSGSGAPVGVGFAVDDRHIVTCAHVVNTALGRDQRAQDRPGEEARVQVDFPMLDGGAGAPSRSCTVAAWVPPPRSGASGGDVAGLVVVGEELPGRAAPARLADHGEFRDESAGVFGYPGNPPRRENGAWAQVRLRGVVGGGVIQLDATSESAFRAQPGYSGSPVIAADGAGTDVVVAMLAAAGGDGAGDAYAIPVAELARAWPDVMGWLTVPACPYRGLGPFTANDADVFVGREDDIARLSDMVRSRALIVVTGPSGVGKSSLVSAGLIPRLEKQGWAAGAFRPAGMPVEALARALAVVQAPARTPTVPEIDGWAAVIRSAGLGGAGSRLALALGRPVVLHADQLEQILDPAACALDRKAEFLELLLSAHAAADEGLHVVGTLRADFWSHLLEHPDAGTRLGDGSFGLSPMSADRLEEVITEPARDRGVRYQEGLARLIAGDAGGGRGLPLLEFALTQLWPLQQGRMITLSAYQGIGGVTGALSQHAEQACKELAGRFPLERVRRVLLALVRSRGGAASATRRAASRNRLGADWEVAQALAGHRLLIIGRDESTGAETAELTHEALIREWPTLASWVNDDAGFQEWVASAEERAADGELLPDTRIAEADRWLAERAGDIPPDVRQLIQDSKSEWTRRVTELENARNRAEALRLAAAAELALATRGTSLQVPIILAIESLKMAPAVEADIAIRHAIRTAPHPISRLDHDGAVRAVAFSPDGTRVATASDDCSARVFDAASGSEISRLDHDWAVTAVAFSPDGTRVATASGDRGNGGSGRVFDAATGTEISRLDHEKTVNAVAFSPDGTRVATASGYLSGGRGSRGSARVFDAATGSEISRLDHAGVVYAVAFSPDGTRVATASGHLIGGNARVFDAATGSEIYRLDHDVVVYAVAFSPDGTRVATASGNQFGSGSAQVFDAATGSEISGLYHDGAVYAVAFSPDGTRVATASGKQPGGGSARVFDAADGSEISRLDHDVAVRAVAFSPEGTRVAIASGHLIGGRGGGGSARVFDAATGTEISRLDHDGAVYAVAFSPDGTRVATASDDRSAWVFHAATGSEISRLDHDGAVHEVAFSPDSSRVATASGKQPGGGSARVFDAATGSEISRLDHDGAV
jgi:WD40 repeat protein